MSEVPVPKVYLDLLNKACIDPVVDYDQLQELGDEFLCQFAQKFLEKKLQDGRDNGRHSWWDSSCCSTESLKEEFILCVEECDIEDTSTADRCDLQDAIVLGLMLHFRQSVGESMNAEQFNKKYPVGSDVIYTDDFGDQHKTKTRSIAWALAHGDVVVKIEGKTGGYGIERISPVRP